MPDAATVAKRKEQGLCTSCGRRQARKKPPSTKCQQCNDRASAAKIAAQKADPEKYAEIQRKRYAEKAKHGICVRCDDLAEPGKERCTLHLLEARDYQKKIRKSEA